MSSLRKTFANHFFLVKSSDYDDEKELGRVKRSEKKWKKEMGDVFAFNSV